MHDKHLVYILFLSHTLNWQKELPALSDMLAEKLPTIADVFCANSSSIHAQFRLPFLSNQDADEILQWYESGCLYKKETNLKNREAEKRKERNRNQQQKSKAMQI